MRRTITVVFCAFLAFTNCGIREGFDRPLTGSNKKVQVHLFSAQWCDTCKEEMVELDHLLKNEFQDKASQILVTVYTVTDVRKLPPSQAAVDAFKKEMFDLHGITFETVVDPWIYQNYRKYFTWTGGDIPAALVLDESGTEVIKKFNPGSGFVVTDIMDAILGALE